MLTKTEETSVLELCEKIKFNKDMELAFEDYFKNPNKKSILKMYQYENEQGDNYFCLFNENKIEIICFVLGMMDILHTYGGVSLNWRRKTCV